MTLHRSEQRNVQILLRKLISLKQARNFDRISNNCSFVQWRAFTAAPRCPRYGHSWEPAIVEEFSSRRHLFAFGVPNDGVFFPHEQWALFGPFDCHII